MADTANAHPTDGRRRKEKGPQSRLALPRLERVSDTERGHSEDSAGEKEAKRQRSNPGTPVSTPRRMPYDYDAVMGITRVGTREAKGFDEDLDSTEYHDANDTTEEPIRKEETETDSQVPTSTGFQGGYGSSSLKECIELLNTTSRIAPAPLGSGVGSSADPPHKMLGNEANFPKLGDFHISFGGGSILWPDLRLLLVWHRRSGNEAQKAQNPCRRGVARNRATEPNSSPKSDMESPARSGGNASSRRKSCFLECYSS